MRMARGTGWPTFRRGQEMEKKKIKPADRGGQRRSCLDVSYLNGHALTRQLAYIFSPAGRRTSMIAIVQLPNLERLSYGLHVVCRMNSFLALVSQQVNMSLIFFVPLSLAPWAISEYIADAFVVPKFAQAWLSIPPNQLVCH